MKHLRLTSAGRFAPVLGLACGLSCGLAAPLALPATSAHAAEYKWGSIFVDMNKPKGQSYQYGIGGGDTVEEADKNALKFCSEDGSKDCTLITRYDVCGAVAGDEKHATGGSGRTADEAKAAAMKNCSAGACKVVASDCN